VSKESQREEKDKADFYRRGFWLCFAYMIWDILRAFGWL
tara:strand:- start:383 stop:499 length:117 start_codon:yes stop_codon:yes gene_type:complete